MKEQQLHDEFERKAEFVRAIASQTLIEHFGERCPDYQPDCECRKRWKALDELLENPYDPEQAT